jgi:hypothetical protein
VGWLPVGLVVGGSDDVGKRVTERMPQVVCAACGAEVVVMHRGPGLLLCVCGVWREVSVFSSTSPDVGGGAGTRQRGRCRATVPPGHVALTKPPTAQFKCCP